jgi:enoyl-CoA hydratase/carnithine racemase
VKRYDAIGEAAQAQLASCEKPVIAMIRGYCIGGGLNIALLCDLRIAADDARFAIPAAKLGLGYRASSMKKLVGGRRRVRARDHDHRAAIHAAEAKAMGLVHQVVPAQSSESSPARFASKSPPMLRSAARCEAHHRRGLEAELRRRGVRRVGEGVLRERGLRRRPQGVHGEAKARFEGR